MVLRGVCRQPHLQTTSERTSEMLEALRKSTSGILAKLLIALLVLSFAVWGIADVVTGGAGRAVAKVGEQDILPDEFQRAYRRELDTLSQQSGRRISQKEAQAIGLDRRVLSRMIGSTAVEAHAGELDLRLSDEALMTSLRADPRFHDLNGNFSATALKNTLAQVGLTEKGFLQLRRQDELRDQIINAMINSAVVPDALIDITHAWREEKRVLEYFKLDAQKVAKLPEATDKDLKDTYEQNKSRFKIPELRQLAILVLSVEALAKKSAIDEKDIKASYEETKDSYNTPEERRVQQISFPDKAAAEKAKKALEGGKDFVEVAKEAGAKETDIDLGTVKKSSLIDKKIADAAFSLKKDKVSDVIEGDFATVLLRVTEIKEGVIKTYEDVKDQVKYKLAQDVATEEMQRLYDQVDDGRGAGKSLKEIADELSLGFVDVPAVSIQNADAEGKLVLQNTNGPRMVRAGFKAEAGIESEPIELADGGFAWVDLISKKEPQQEPFEKVKDEVVELWKENKLRELVNDVTKKAVERLKNGEDITALAKEIGQTTVSKSEPISRSTIPQGLTQAAVTQSFLLPKDGVSSAQLDDNASRAVFRVVEVKEAEKATGDARKKLNDELLRQVQRDQLAEYIEGLQTRLGVTINEQQFQQVTGRNQL